MINYHDVPVSESVKSFIAEWLPYQNEGPAMEIHSCVEQMLPKTTNPFEFGLLSHLHTVIGFLYEYADGIVYDNESWTPGLEGDEEFEKYIEMTVTQSMQRYVDEMQKLHSLQRPNRLFPCARWWI
jgi:hypothetical protein